MPKADVIKLSQYRKVLQPQREWLLIDNFFNLEPVFCQRQTNYRAPKIKRLLKKQHFQSHLDVAVFEYPDGTRVKGNGNTRDVCWKDFKEDGLYEYIPSHVNATIYFVANDDEAKALYYTFDSDDSVEKTADKITGVYRALNLTFNNDKIAKGNTGKALEYASATRRSNSVNSRNPDWFAIVEDFKDELTAFDAIGPKKIYDATLTCASLMMLKRHGTKNKLLLTGLKQLNDKSKGAQHPKFGTDGITKILEEWTTHALFEDKQTSGVAFPKQLDFVLWCFEKWMNKTNAIRFRKPTGKLNKGRGCRRDVYETFWV
jgi:hypothetical protein